MVLLLAEDANRPLPPMYAVKQTFEATKLADIKQAVKDEFAKSEITATLKPGMKVALAVGSRGINNLSLIVKTTIDCLLDLGTEPFIIAAMGSHGAGTIEGQLKMLHTYGITEQAMGVKVIASNDVDYLGQTSLGIDVYFDSLCLSDKVDAIIPLNRIKLHTDFVDTIQSGLCKMLVIGLGHHQGCSAIHEADFEQLGPTIKEAAAMILDKAQGKVKCGLAIIENAYDQTALIEAVPADILLKREEQLVQIAKKNMPLLMVPEIDVLIVEQIGKDISGAGFDPNILGRSSILKKFVLPVPKIQRMVLLGTTLASKGNAIGMGDFDIMTKNVFDELDLEPIYANCIAIKCLDSCKIPLVAADEAEAVRIAIKLLSGHDPDNLKIVKIKNTLELGQIEISEALLPIIDANPQLSLIGAI